MLKVPNLRGKFICGPCGNSEAGYTAVEHIISYRLPRHDCVTINGLAAFCDSCGKYASIPAIEDYNEELARETYAHPELAVSIPEAAPSDSDSITDIPLDKHLPVEETESSLSLASGDDYFNDFYAEDESGQMEFTDLIANP